MTIPPVDAPSGWGSIDPAFLSDLLDAIENPTLPPAYAAKKRIRGLVGLAFLCAVAIANDRRGTWETVFFTFVHSLGSILPKYSLGDRQTIARKWILRYV